MPSFTELELSVLRWAEARDIIAHSNSTTQFMKTVSELGELSDALIKHDRDGIIDGLGDVLVTLILVADLEGLDLKTCLESAYNTIKDRKGKLLPNGVFVKEQ